MQKESVSKQGRKSAKAEPSVHKDPLFDELPEDTLDYIETEDAQDVGRTREVSTDKKKVSTDRQIVSTDGSKVSTNKEKDSTDRTDEGIDDQTKGGRATQTTQTPTSTIFGDDETIAQVLLNMSQAKAVSKEKEKGVEFKDFEETERPSISEAERSFSNCFGMKWMARKVQEDWEAEEEVKKLAEEEAIKTALSNEYDFIQARIEADRLLALRLQDEE
ncbi:hypothetical protein Tco_0889221 [Tanacetum coccineum]